MSWEPLLRVDAACVIGKGNPRPCRGPVKDAPEGRRRSSADPCPGPCPGIKVGMGVCCDAGPGMVPDGGIRLETRAPPRLLLPPELLLPPRVERRGDAPATAPAPAPAPVPVPVAPRG